MHAWTSRLHCTCQAICASSWSGKSTSAGGKECRSSLYWGGQTSGGHSLCRDYVETGWILSRHGVMTVRHQQPWCWPCSVFDIGCDPAGGITRFEEHNLKVCTVDSHTKNRLAARNDVGHYTHGTLQAILLKPVYHGWSCHLHREHCRPAISDGNVIEYEML